jgi:putative oxidoreductase
LGATIIYIHIYFAYIFVINIIFFYNFRLQTFCVQILPVDDYSLLNLYSMNALLGLGKYLYAIPFAVFGIFHFMNADAMAGMAFGQVWLVYLTGVAHIAATVSMLIGKMDKLATVLLALMLIIFVLAVHLQGAMDGDQGSMSALLKDVMLAGAALLYAKNEAKDNAVIG